MLRSRFLLPLVLAVGLGLPARAQIGFDVFLSQAQFLSGESLPVSVRITNFSGQTLPLGKNTRWLQFTLERKDGYPIAQKSTVPVNEPFELENSTIATLRFDLAPHFETMRPGRHLLRAVLDVDPWSRRLAAPVKEFDVIAGTVLWEQTVGVPRASGEAGGPELRSYSLQQAIHLEQMKLYVRVTDGTGTSIYGLFPLGPMLTFSTPEKQIDRESRLHVLYQTGARTFTYSVISPDAKVVVRQTHEYAGASRPTLKMTDRREIAVRGGMRVPARDDVPPFPAPTPASDGKTSPPPATVTAPAAAPATNAPAAPAKPAR